MNEPRIGIIGGTGLGDLLEKQGGEAVEVDTPFGPPSGPLIRGEWNGCPVVFLHRHGQGHRFSPSTVPYRANIYALKALGVTRILASGATGSLREDIAPGDLVLCDQVIDKTCRRASTFFDGEAVAHVELAEPFCPRLRSHLQEASSSANVTVHRAGTYVCMEGPQFSTRAESQMHRLWGGDLVGMTCMPEAKLAREAEMCYALVAFPTDYDCWRPPAHEADKSELLREILSNLKRASDNALALLGAAVQRLAELGEEDCPCRHSLKLALWTLPNAISRSERERLSFILGPYITERL